MKKLLTSIVCIAIVALFALFALASGESDTVSQSSGAADAASKPTETVSKPAETANDSNLGDYEVEIMSCRLAKDYEKKPVVIVKYKFTNNSEEATSFTFALSDNVYQNGIGLTTAIVTDDSAKYSSDNQMKEIKKGASLEVEVAYVLNDTTTDIEVEVEERISFSDKTITKTFSIK